MKIRWTKLICGLLFGLCLIAVCILAGRKQYRSFREIHCVSAAFDRDGAYKLTAELAENYPYRVFGTEESRKAGKMIEDRLREYGLDVRHQVFLVPASR